MTDNIWLVVCLGAFATFMWRFAGIAIAQFVKPDSLFMLYVNAAAHAMVAGVMSIILVFPVGSLSTTETEYRLLSFALALLIMLLSKRLGLAILTGLISFALIQSGLVFQLIN